MKNPKSLSSDLLICVDVEGQSYSIDLAFDNVFKFFRLIDPDRLTERRIIAAFFILVPDASLNASKLSRKAILEALNYLVEYINWTPYAEDEGQQRDIIGKPLPIMGTQEKYYDFEQDSMAIYASFKSAYGIDLWDERGRLHWTKFQALLLALPDDCLFKKIVGIRQSNPQPPSGTDVAGMQEYTRLIAQKRQFALKTSLLERLQALDN